MRPPKSTPWRPEKEELACKHCGSKLCHAIQALPVRCFRTMFETPRKSRRTPKPSNEVDEDGLLPVTVRIIHDAMEKSVEDGIIYFHDTKPLALLLVGQIMHLCELSNGIKAGKKELPHSEAETPHDERCDKRLSSHAWSSLSPRHVALPLCTCTTHPSHCDPWTVPTHFPHCDIRKFSF